MQVLGEGMVRGKEGSCDHDEVPFIPFVVVGSYLLLSLLYSISYSYSHLLFFFLILSLS